MNIVSSRIKCIEERTSKSRRELSELQLLEFHRSFVDSCNFQFREKDNEERYKTNEQILECLRDAEEYLNDVVNKGGCAKAESALNSLVQSINMLLHAQTLIKLADTHTDNSVLPYNPDSPEWSVEEETETEVQFVMSPRKCCRLRARRFAISTSTQVDFGDKGAEESDENAAGKT